MNRSQGFTIIELMVAIAVAGVLLSVAVPSFQNIARNNAVRAVTNDLIATINLARQQSMSMRSEVSITPATGGWSNGWNIDFAEDAAGEDATYSGRDGVSVTSAATELAFRARGGMETGAGSTFTVEHASGSSSTLCRVVKVNFFGKTTLEPCP